MSQESNTKIIITKAGGPEVLKEITEPLVQPKNNEVLIRIKYTSVSYADILMRLGVYPGSPKMPFTPGYEITGEVKSVGQNVKNIKPGQKVCALTVNRGYAQYISLPENEVIVLPDNEDLRKYTVLVLNYLTAWQMLHRIAKVKENDTILIHGAGGGVGTALLQLGRLKKLKMYGTASKSKHEIVESFGGIPIDYNSQDFKKIILESDVKGVNAVFDALGGKSWPKSYSTLKRKGCLVAYGMTQMVKDNSISPMDFIKSFITLGSLFIRPGRRTSFYSINIYKNPRWYQDDMAELIKLIQNGDIEPVIDSEIPLKNVAEAHQKLYDGKVKGKIILNCQ